VSVITPKEIARRTEKVYRKYLKLWLNGEDEGFFPYHMPADLKIDRTNPSSSQTAIELLREKSLRGRSKEQRGWGYTLKLERLETPLLGYSDVPSEIWIDTLDDLLRLSQRQVEFARTRQVVNRVRAEFPELEDWLRAKAAILAIYEPHLDRLVAVAKYLVAHPRPGCYFQQLPLAVDTTFSVEHRAVLTQWLNVLLPAESIETSATDFSVRFGLLKPKVYRGVFLLDDTLLGELGFPFAEFGLPLTSLKQMVANDVTVIIYENQKSFVSLPRLPRSIGVCGEGASAADLATVPFIQQNRVLYWGDVDAAGLAILSQLRARLPHVESVLMNLDAFNHFLGKPRSGKGHKPTNVKHLTQEEQAAFDYCCKHNVCLEQERILQDQVCAAFAEKFAGE